jgi:hypothetical protein
LIERKLLLPAQNTWLHVLLDLSYKLGFDVFFFKQNAPYYILLVCRCAALPIKASASSITKSASSQIPVTAVGRGAPAAKTGTRKSSRALFSFFKIQVFSLSSSHQFLAI